MSHKDTKKWTGVTYNNPVPGEVGRVGDGLDNITNANLVFLANCKMRNKMR